MLIHSFGGPKVRQLRIILLPLDFNSSFVSQQTLNQTNTLRVDLVVTDQPNLDLHSGTRPFNGANRVAIKRSMVNFPWVNIDPKWQVKAFTDTIFNIMSNFLSNKTKRIVHRDPCWITKQLKTMLNRKNRLSKICKRHWRKHDDKVRLDAFRTECQLAVETAKLSYQRNVVNINRVDKCRVLVVPPPHVNIIFVLNCSKTGKHFIDFFSQQCKLIVMIIKDGEILPLRWLPSN